jgi:Flp pilus assembly protein TadG
MIGSLYSVFRPLRGFFRDKSGATVVFFAAMVPAAVGLAGLSVDLGRAMVAKRSLDAETQAAAMAGANALTTATAANAASAVSAAITSWNTANPVSGVTMTGTPSPTLRCVTSTANLPTCSGTSPNAVALTQTGTVPTFFLKAIGRSSITLTSTATAAKAGGTPQPLSVMFVLDATGSMNSTDAGCSVPNVTHPTRFQCALYSIQSVIKTMPLVDKVGLMIFPGMGSQYSPTAHPCTTQPASVPYLSANIKYQIGTTLDNTYNNGAGALNNSSPLVQAVGNGTALTGCVTAKGGEGSYAAEVIAKAQAALPTSGTQNVIIFLSDGDYGASASQLSNQTSKVNQQCDQAVNAAQAATTAGTQVYAVAYGAPSTGCSKNDTRNPCTTMQAIASDSSKFYSTDASCKITGSTNTIGQLPLVFQSIQDTLNAMTKPRLLPN